MGALNKSYKNKMNKIQDDIFEIGATRQTAQFTKSRKSKANFVQLNWSSYMAGAIRAMKEQNFYQA